MLVFLYLHSGEWSVGGSARDLASSAAGASGVYVDNHYSYTCSISYSHTYSPHFHIAILVYVV
jgi:hypothetical protein